MLKRNPYLLFLVIVMAFVTLACTCGALESLTGRAEATLEAVVTEVAATIEPTAAPTMAPTSPPEPTATSAPAGEIFSSEPYGVTFMVPAGWTMQEEGDGAFVVVSDPALLDADNLRDGAGVFILSGAILTLFDVQGEELLAFAAEQLFELQDASLVRGPDTIQIQGQEAIQAEYEGVADGVPVRLTATYIDAGVNQALVVALYTREREELAAPVAELIASVSLSAATVAVPTVAPPAVSSDGGDLAPGVVRAATMVEGLTQRFVFSGLADRPVMLLAQPADEDLDLILTVYDLDDNELATIDEGFSGEVEYLIFTPEADGDYVVEVGEFLSGGDYYLGVLPLEDEGPGILLAETTSVASGGEVNYTLTAAPGEAILFVIEPEEDLDAEYDIYDDADNLLVEVDENFSGEPEAAIFVAPEPGEYRLRVYPFTSGGEFRIIIGAAAIVPAGEADAGDVDIPSASTQFRTSFPMPDAAVSNFIQTGTGDSEAVNYAVNLSLIQVAQFYRRELRAQGLTERDVTTIITDEVVNLVFDGADNGRAVVIQVVSLGGGTVNVNVRYEDL